MKNYPDILTEKYELLECLSHSDPDGAVETETLLARKKDTGDMCVAKCFYKGSALYDVTISPVIKNIECDGVPGFIEEIKDDGVRVEIREYLPGRTLAEYIRDRDLSDGEVREIALQICGILEKLHNNDPR